MALDFPSNPSDGQIYDDYYFDATVGVWQSNGGTSVPNIFKNAVYTTAETNLVPVIVRGKTGQSANMQQWTDANGNVLASLDSSGNMSVQSLTSVQPMVSVPTGALMPYAGASAPSQFLLCDGSAVLKSLYPDLFNIIGSSYGNGNGSTTFNLPNLMGRTAVGAGAGAQNGGSGSGVVSGGTAMTARSLGQFSGAETHTLIEAQSPSHTHTMAHTHTIAHTHTFSGTTNTTGAHTHNTYANWNTAGGPNYNTGTPGDARGNPTDSQGNHSHTYSGTTSASSSASSGEVSTANTGNFGSGGAHNNLQPFTVVNYIIKT